MSDTIIKIVPMIGPVGPQGPQGPIGPSGGPVGPQGPAGAGYAPVTLYPYSIGNTSPGAKNFGCDPLPVSWSEGSRVRVLPLFNGAPIPSIFMDAYIQSITPGRDDITIYVDYFEGTWTSIQYEQWQMVLTGQRGSVGPVGPVGITGQQGEQGLRGFEFSNLRVGADQYKIGEIIFYGAQYYICIADNDAIVPGPGSIGVYWNQYSFSGSGLPTGGIAGQVLSKVDSQDFNVQWTAVTSGGSAEFTSVLKHTVKAATSISKGQAVYISSADGTNMYVSKASNSTEATSSKVLGLIESSATLNQQVNVITEGLLSGLNTQGTTAGDPVWLGTDGNLLYGLANKPVAPAHLVFIGVVTRVNQNNGEIFVRPQNGFELQELHNVLIQEPVSDNSLLAFDTANNMWLNKTLDQIGISLSKFEVNVDTSSTKILDTLPLTGFAGIEYIMTIRQGLKVRTSTIIMHTNGSVVDATEYGILETGGAISGLSITTTNDSNYAYLNIIIPDATLNNATVRIARTMN